MKKIAIPIETKVREFDGKLWLGMNLVSRGHSFVLGPAHEVFDTLDITRPDVYISKDAGDNSIEIFDQLHSAGISVCGLDTEGAVFQSIENFTHNKKNVLNHIDSFFTWGEKQANGMRKQFSEANNVHVTGNPRFDLLQSHLRFIYQNQAVTLNQKYGEYILFNGNFSFANPYEQHVIDKNEEIYGSTQIDKRTYAHRTFYRFLDAVYHLQGEFPEMSIIIRPHPSENNKTYEEAFDGYDNIHIEDTGDVRTWISGASVTLHHDCTTGIESALMRVPVVSYRPFQNEEYEMELPQRVSKQAFTLDELTEYISQSLRTDEPYELDRKQTAYLKQYFHNVNESAAENICNVIESLDKNKENNYDELKPNLRGDIERRIKSSSWSNQATTVYDTIQELLGNEPRAKQRQYYKQKFPGLEKKEILERIEQIEQVLDLGPVAVEQVPMTNNTFYIRPKS